MRLFLLFSIIIFSTSCSHKTIAPASPAPEAWKPIAGNIPLSEINIPVRISLQPLYQVAEGYVDKEFKSEGWPNEWVYDGCNTRYMYHFRRGPLQLSFSGRRAEMDFTCFYQVKGAQRGCLAGVGVTPWSPPCSCGMNEPERRIQLGFSADFYVRNDYTVGANVSVKEPKTPDPCEVCFFKSDITSMIVKNVKPQLDTARVYAMKQMGAVSLRPQVQQLWNQLQQPVPLGGYGFFYINPEQILLNRLSADKDFLNVSIGLTARPHAGFERPEPIMPALPLLQGGVDTGGFKVYADVHLTYDSLSRILNEQLGGMRIEGEKGVVKNKYVEVKEASVSSAGGNRLSIKIKVKGSVDGTVYLTGRPTVDTATGTLTINDLDYDVSTRNLLVSTAEWMLNKKITRKLNDAARFELNTYLQKLQASMNTGLNRNLGKGITTNGSINRITVAEITPQPGYLFVRLFALGNMNVLVSEFSL